MIEVSKNPDDNWNNDKIQFARLLGEMNAVVDFTTDQKKDLCESMNLSWDEIGDILCRAQDTWDDIKTRT